jgi:hypothetical protein
MEKLCDPEAGSWKNQEKPARKIFMVKGDRRSW